MNKTTILHQTQSELLNSVFSFIDERADKNAKIGWEQCYVIGLRVTATLGEHHQYAMIVANDHEHLMIAIEKIKVSLVDFVNIKLKEDITVIYLHNLMTHDLGESEAARKLKSTLDYICASSDMLDDGFIAFGFDEDGQIYISESNTDDALQAIDDAKVEFLERLGHQFMPALVCESHSISKEKNELLEFAVRGFTQLMKGAPIHVTTYKYCA